ncbi:MAG: hypothetical protein LBL25_05215, partial [Oscillospiraceae bacterium]|nr:hypothetical protein [Oscillospiraceae bacterium]
PPAPEASELPETPPEPEARVRPIETFEAEDRDLEFFENYKYSSEEPDDEIIRSVTEAIESAADETRSEPRRGIFFPRSIRQPEPFTEPEPEKRLPEPDYRERARYYAARCNSLSGRSVLALVLAIAITALTFVFEGGGRMPFGIGRNAVYARGALLIAQLAVMLLGVDILIRGARELFAGKASAESLVFISCSVSVLAGIYGLRSGGDSMPYSAAAALSLTFAIWGERLYTHSLADTLRTAATVKDPYSVVSERRADLDRTVLRKAMGRQRGFYDNLSERDVCETAYSYASPILMIFCAIISLYAAAAHKSLEYVPAMLSATAAASAAFTATTAFAMPFRSAVRRAKRRNTAIAGAGGAEDVFYIDGCCVGDDDVYPPDTLDLGSLRILEQVSPEKAIRYTASLIVASGSCLARKFTEILVKEGMSLITTQDFAVSEGGVSGVIRGETVLTGNYAFMNLHGIRVPDELKLSNSIYTAVDKRLIAMFSVDYRPSGAVRNALLSVLRHTSRLFLTVRDFNITPMTIEQKFKIPMEDFELLPIRSAYELGDSVGESGSRAAAICARGGLPELSGLIAAARAMKIVSLIMTAVSIAAAAAGVLLMSIRVWAGGPAAARPGTLVLFMLTSVVLTALLELFSALRVKS